MVTTNDPQLAETVRTLAPLYTSLLQDVPGLTLPVEELWAEDVFWLYGMLVEDEFGLTRDELCRCLAEEGIETRTFFVPMHLQPIYYDDFNGEQVPVAEDPCKQGLYLLSASSLTWQEIESVVQVAKASGRSAS